MGLAEADVDAIDVDASFELLRGSVGYGRGIRMRTMIRGSGVVRPLASGSEVLMRFRPHWEAVAWLSFGGGLSLVGLVALIASLAAGSGPLLWPLVAVAVFGGFCVWKVRQLRTARRDMEQDLARWLSD